MGSPLSLPPSLLGGNKCFYGNELPIFHYAESRFEKVAKSLKCFSLRNTYWMLALSASDDGQRPASVGGAALALCFARVEHWTLAQPDRHVRSPFAIKQT